MRKGELLEEERVSATMVVARELAASDRQVIHLLEDHQAAPVTFQIHVTAQQEQTEHTNNRSPSIGTKKSVRRFGGLISA
jgi:hypothetical protein